MREHIPNEKAARQGGFLNFHNSILSTPSILPQADNFKHIGDLVKELMKDVVTVSSSNDRGGQDGE